MIGTRGTVISGEPGWMNARDCDGCLNRQAESLPQYFHADFPDAMPPLAGPDAP